MCVRTQKMDPQMRKLLEVTHEAFVDSGIDYKALRGSPRVGVYLGCCGSEVREGAGLGFCVHPSALTC